MKHILLIDDNTIDNYINKVIISKAKIAHLITTKNSGLEALAFLTSLHASGKSFPEIIFLDLQMPEMDGFQFLDQYTKFSEEAKKNSTIYMLTSSNNPEDVKKAGDCLSIKNFFNKPLSSELVAQI